MKTQKCARDVDGATEDGASSRFSIFSVRREEGRGVRQQRQGSDSAGEHVLPEAGNRIVFPSIEASQLASDMEKKPFNRITFLKIGFFCLYFILSLSFFLFCFPTLCNFLPLMF